MKGTVHTAFWFGTIAAALAGTLGGECRAAERADLLAAVHSITRDEAKALVDTLADDSFEGREAGSRGGRAAGNLLMKEFEKNGLRPMGDGGSYFQAFQGTARNVLGLLEGSDPQLKQQMVVVGAHYDHVGYGRVTNSFGPFGYVHNGADDNASGVSGLLEIVAAMQQLPEAPRRSILFALWDAEEQGLHGSQHWVGQATLDRSRVVAAINMDMIGRLRNGRVEVYGTRTSAGLRRIVSESNRDADLALDFSWKMKADSDHWPFFTRSIPTLMFHTGLHEHYHRPSDDSHTVNAEGIAQVARVALLTVLELANRDETGGFREASRRENPAAQAQLEQPVAAQPSRFGMPLRVVGEPPQFVLESPSPGSPADKAGVKAGDRLLAYEGQPITSEAKLRQELLAAAGPVRFSVQRPGEEAPREITIQPAGSPIRVGITWREDPAEPATVLLTQVVYGSAAHAAGLQTHDRIYRVNGQKFADAGAFAELVTRLPSPLEFEYERQGRVRTARLEVIDQVAVEPAAR